jgi:hypothetical protein
MPTGLARAGNPSPPHSNNFTSQVSLKIPAGSVRPAAFSSRKQAANPNKNKTSGAGSMTATTPRTANAPVHTQHSLSMPRASPFR